MSLRDRLRRVLFELTKPKESPAATKASSAPPAPPLTTPTWHEQLAQKRMWEQLQRPKVYTPVPRLPKKCCYCRRNLTVYAPDVKFKGIRAWHTVMEEDGHVMCGVCFLAPGVKWPCQKDHE